MQRFEKIGLTALTLVTLAVAATFMLSAYHLERQVVPEFMLTNISLPCSGTELAKFADLVVVLSSDKDSIVQVTKRLAAIKTVRTVNDQTPISNSLFELRDHDDAFLEATKTPAVWVAYTVDKTPQYTPPIPVPVMFNQPHTMRLFVVGRDKLSLAGQGDSSALDSNKPDLKLIAQVNFAPDAPKTSVQNAQLEVKFFGVSDICGKKKQGA